MKRREFLKLSVAAVAIAALSRQARAQTAVTEIRIGYQKNGVLVIARQQAALEKHFAPQAIGVKWVEFSSGPPMLEAMNVGSVSPTPMPVRIRYSVRTPIASVLERMRWAIP